jgi:hypothetical protein
MSKEMIELSGHEKLVAKIQHFYEVLVQLKDTNGDQAISSPSTKQKVIHHSYYQEYEKLEKIYEDVFKDFLYT